MKLKYVISLVLILICMEQVLASIEKQGDFKSSITPFLNIQFWNVASQGITSGQETSANRFVSYFRRGRFGVKGKVLPELSYNLMLSFDNLGKDGFLSTKGVVNTGEIGIWSAYFTYNLNNKNNWLNITGGYFLPHLSRESTTSPWTVSSLDKTENSCYLRQFVTGKANGICPGINLGGVGKPGGFLLIYNLALINRQDMVSIMNENWSPVVLAHAMINFGVPELNTYKYCFSNNSLKKQTSVTFGMGVSTQGKTDVFQTSQSVSADATIYLGSLKLDGEYSHFYRKNQSKYKGNCFMERVSYNIFLKKYLVLEPVVMFEKFDGDQNYEDALFFDGIDKKIDIGLNLIASKKRLKLNLHYVQHNGSGTKNRFIKNDERAGNYVVFGLQILI